MTKSSYSSEFFKIQHQSNTVYTRLTNELSKHFIDGVPYGNYSGAYLDDDANLIVLSTDLCSAGCDLLKEKAAYNDLKVIGADFSYAALKIAETTIINYWMLYETAVSKNISSIELNEPENRVDVGLWDISEACISSFKAECCNSPTVRFIHKTPAVTADEQMQENDSDKVSQKAGDALFPGQYVKNYRDGTIANIGRLVRNKTTGSIGFLTSPGAFEYLDSASDGNDRLVGYCTGRRAGGPYYTAHMSSYVDKMDYPYGNPFNTSTASYAARTIIKFYAQYGPNQYVLVGNSQISMASANFEKDRTRYTDHIRTLYAGNNVREGAIATVDTGYTETAIGMFNYSRVSPIAANSITYWCKMADQYSYHNVEPYV